MHSLTPPPMRYWRVALLLVAGALLSPQRASAECGNHVTVLHPTTEARHDHMPQPASADTGAPVKVPCQGPNCSGAPDRHSPVPVTVTPTGPQGKQIVRSAEHLDRSGERPGLFARDDSTPHPVYRSIPIFHPPRHG